MNAPSSTRSGSKSRIDVSHDPCGNRPGPQKADILIRNGMLFDGDSLDPYTGDIAVTGKRILAIGDLRDWTAHEVIDASGFVVTPGFIDVHTHDDAAVIKTPSMSNKVRQGITTVVIGNCGVSLAPIIPTRELPAAPFSFLGPQSDYKFGSMFEYRAAVDRAAPRVNVVMLVGHTTLRAAVMDDMTNGASPGQLAQMKDLLDRSLLDGCVGLSTGLAYPPAMGAPSEEIIELAKVVSHHHGIYATHIRDEADGVIEAVEEALRIAKTAQTSVLISHHKCMGKSNWGKSRKTLALIDASCDTLDIALDVYPYTASSTALLAHKIRHAERVIVTESSPHPEQNGNDLADIAAQWGSSMEDAVAQLHPAKALYFQMSEDDLVRIMKHPATMIGSDGMQCDRHPHPRLFGTFPRVLGKYVREERHLALGEAIRKMTALPAQTFDLADRGILRPGHFADIAIFDADNVVDRATYADPRKPPEGIKAVIFEGQIVHSGSDPSGPSLTLGALG